MYLPTKILRLIANGKYSTLTKSERLILPVMATNADKHTGEGVLSIGSISRLTGLARNTVKKAYRSLVGRSIIQDYGNKPGYGITWRFINVPDLRKMTPPDTVNRCMTVLIDSTHSTRLVLCTSTLDAEIKMKSRSKKTKLKNDWSELGVGKRENDKYPDWWEHIANILTKRRRKTLGYRNAILKTWKARGHAEIAYIKVNNPKEAEKLLSSQNTQENREAWTKTIRDEMKKDIKPNGKRGHLAWVANYLACEKSSARVVVFKLGGKEAGARQWAPALLGLLRRLSKQWAGPTLVLKDDGWRESYTAGKSRTLYRKKSKTKTIKLHDYKPEQTRPAPSYPPPREAFLKPSDHSVWMKTLQALQSSLHTQSYTTWIKPLNIYHSEASVLWLECENKYAAEFISANYIVSITTALKKIAPYQGVRLCVLPENE